MIETPMPRANQRPWLIYILTQDSMQGQLLMRLLQGRELWGSHIQVQLLQQHADVRWAQQQLELGAQLPHMVIFDELNVAMQSPLLVALREYPEVAKVLYQREWQEQIMRMAFTLCGIDSIIDSPSNQIDDLFQTLLRMAPLWSEDRRLPVRQYAQEQEKYIQALSHQNNELEAQSEALAQANVRTLGTLEALQAQGGHGSQKEQALQHAAQLLFQSQDIEESALFQGSLAEVSLIDLMRFANLSKSSLLMTVLHRGQQAAIAMWDGELLHAVCGGYRGMEAISYVMQWNWGEYFVQRIDAPTERTIHVHTEQILFQESAHTENYVLSQYVR